jgi:hypothetical protein
MAIERLLDLPKGSAWRRRLTVLAVTGDHVPGTEIAQGDRLIVEPGAHATNGHLLACQSPSGLLLRRLRFPARGAPVLASPDEESLPLGDGVPCTILGTVLAAVRFGGDGEARVAFAPRYRFVTTRLYPSFSRASAPIDLTVRRAKSSLLQSVLASLDAQQVRGPQALRQLEGAKTRLRTLGKCLDAVDDERIYGALVREINAIVLRLSRSLALARSWAALVHDSGRANTKTHRRTTKDPTRSTRGRAAGAVTHSAKYSAVDRFKSGVL